MEVDAEAKKAIEKYGIRRNRYVAESSIALRQGISFASLTSTRLKASVCVLFPATPSFAARSLLFLQWTLDLGIPQDPGARNQVGILPTFRSIFAVSLRLFADHLDG